MMDFNVGDKIVSKKKHPCGSDVWEITRTGVDFKIKCTKCQHTVMMDRQDFLRIVKRKEEN